MDLRRELWTFLTPLAGLNLWLVVCLMPLRIEWLAEDTRLAALAAYLVPLGVLAAGMVLRWPSVLLLGYVSSLLPAWFLLPTLDREVYQSPQGFLPLAVALLAYVVIASIWIGRGPLGSRRSDRSRRRQGLGLETTPLKPRSLARDLWWPYKGYFPPRWVLMLLFLLVPIYGLNFAPGVAERYVESFANEAEAAQVMGNLLFVFVWIVVVYLLFISPGLNLELEQRDLDLAIRHEDARIAKKSRVWLIAVAAVLAGISMAALVLVRQG